MTAPMMRPALLALLLLASLSLAGCGTGNDVAKSDDGTKAENHPDPDLITGQLHWRGVHQNGTSNQTDLPDAIAVEGDGANLRWTLDVPGRGTAAIAAYPDGPRLFALGYPGQGAELTETLYCLDPETGEEIWSRSYADFISDIVYNRYTIGGPTVDPQTGHVYIQTSPGLLIALDRDGNELWQISLLEQFGKLTFPNGRTGVVTIDGDLAIVNCISTNWGSEGPARNRFYAFDKITGELVWSSTPGVGPPFLSDSSFSTPHIEGRQGYRVFYAGTGCGNLVCVNIRTGAPLWRYQMSMGGVNASPLIYDNGTPDDAGDDLIIQVHGKENIGDSGRGYMIAIRADQALKEATASHDEPLKVENDLVAWRNDDVSMFTSSPTVVDGVVYQCALDGRLVAIDAKSGETLWEKKLGASQLHASPLYADGKLYIPYWNDGLFILTPSRTEPTDVKQTKLAGKSIGTAAAWNGKVYVHSTDRLYCFGNDRGGALEASDSHKHNTAPQSTTSGPGAIMFKPSEFKLRPKEQATISYSVVDAAGNTLHMDDQNRPQIGSAHSVGFADKEAELNISVHGDSQAASTTVSMSAENDAAFAYIMTLNAKLGELKGQSRGRIISPPPYSLDFDRWSLHLTDKTDDIAYAHPPSTWIGARLKWQVRDDPYDDGGNKVLAKTLDRVLFQRSMVFMGHADDSGYTVQADVMSDGNRRGMSVVGVINQRYIIALDGNKQAIEISSNHNRIAETAKFKWKPKTWYTIKSMVVPSDDGGGTVYGKAWPRGEDEPADWTLSVEVPNCHKQGSPGIFGFSPQSKHRVYVDNVKVDPNP